MLISLGKNILFIITILLYILPVTYQQCCSQLQQGICIKCPSKMHLYRGSCIYDLPGCSVYDNGFDCKSCLSQYSFMNGICTHDRIPFDKYNMSSFTVYLQSALKPDPLLVQVQQQIEQNQQLWVDWYNYSQIHFNHSKLSKSRVYNGAESLHNKVIANNSLLHYIHTGNITTIDGKIYLLYRFTYQLIKVKGFSDLLVGVETVSGQVNYIELSTVKVNQLSVGDWKELSSKDIELLYVMNQLQNIFPNLNGEAFLKGFSQKDSSSTNFTLFYMSSSKGTVLYNYQADNVELPKGGITINSASEVISNQPLNSTQKQSINTNKNTSAITPNPTSPSQTVNNQIKSNNKVSNTTTVPSPTTSPTTAPSPTATQTQTASASSILPSSNQNQICSKSSNCSNEVKYNITYLNTDPIFAVGYAVAINQLQISSKAVVIGLFLNNQSNAHTIYFYDSSIVPNIYIKFSFGISEGGGQFEVLNLTKSAKSFYQNESNPSSKNKTATTAETSSSSHPITNKTQIIKVEHNTTKQNNQTKTVINPINPVIDSPKNNSTISIIGSNQASCSNKSTLNSIDISSKLNSDIFLPRINMLLRTMYGSQLSNSQITQARYNWSIDGHNLINNITYYLRYTNVDNHSLIFQVAVVNNQFVFISLPSGITEDGVTPYVAPDAHQTIIANDHNHSNSTNANNSTIVNHTETVNIGNDSHINSINMTANGFNIANTTNSTNSTTQLNHTQQIQKDKQTKTIVIINQTKDNVSPIVINTELNKSMSESNAKTTNYTIINSPVNQSKKTDKNSIQQNSSEPNQNNKSQTVVPQKNSSSKLQVVHNIVPTKSWMEPKYKSLVTILKSLYKLPSNVTVHSMQQWLDSKLNWHYLITIYMDLAMPLADGSNLKISIYELQVNSNSFVSVLNSRIQYSNRNQNGSTVKSSTYSNLITNNNTLSVSKVKQGPLSLQISSTPYLKDLFSIFINHSPRLKNYNIKSTGLVAKKQMFGELLHFYHQTIIFQNSLKMFCFKVDYQVSTFSGEEGRPRLPNDKQHVQINGYQSTNCSQLSSNLFIYNLTGMNFQQTLLYSSKVNSRLLSMSSNRDLSIRNYQQYGLFYRVRFNGQGLGEQQVIIDSDLMIILYYRANPQIVHDPSIIRLDPLVVTTLETQIKNIFKLTDNQINVFMIRKLNPRNSQVWLLDIHAKGTSNDTWTQNLNHYYNLKGAYWHKTSYIKIYNFSIYNVSMNGAYNMPTIQNWIPFDDYQLMDSDNFASIMIKLKEQYSNFLQFSKIVLVFIPSNLNISIEGYLNVTNNNISIKLLISKQYTNFKTNYLLTVGYNQMKKNIQIKSIETVTPQNITIDFCLNKIDNDSLPTCVQCLQGYRLFEGLCVAEIQNCQEYYGTICLKCKKGKMSNSFPADCKPKEEERKLLILSTINYYLFGERQW